MRIGLVLLCSAALFGAGAQERKPIERTEAGTANRRLDDGGYVLAAGTNIPLTLMNTVSSRNAAPGDRLYFQTMIPTAVGGRIIIPAGAYVTAKVTKSIRPGKVKGKGELALQFETLMFPRGATLNLTGGLGAIDGDNPGRLERKEGGVTSEGSVARDATVIGSTTVAGTAMGRWTGRSGRNAGIGAGAGAATGLAAVLLTRGPEATLRRGSTVEMVLRQDLRIPSEYVADTR